VTIRHEFTVHRLTGEGMVKAAEIAEEFSKLLDRVEVLVPQAGDNARELALVRTKLQEACFFAKRAMALHPKYHELIRPGDPT
jgi:hypothetical protein